MCKTPSLTTGCANDCGNCQPPRPHSITDSKLRKLVNKSLAVENFKEEPAVEKMIQYEVDQLTAEAWKKFEAQLIDNLIPKLRSFGVDARLDNVPEWAKRITKISEGDEYFRYYLDWTERGPHSPPLNYLISTNEIVKMDVVGPKITVTIG